MRISAILRSWWRNLVSRRAVEADLDAELSAYLELLAAEKERAGADPATARRQALLELRGLEPVKEEVRRVRRGAALDSLRLDLRHAFRLLARSPGFSLVAVLTLALGIGANTALYSVIRGVLLEPLPYPEPERLALVSRHFAKSTFRYGNLCLLDFVEWRSRNRSFEEPAVFRSRSFDLLGGSEPVEVSGAEVTVGFFPTLAVAPLRGRVFDAAADGANAPRVVVISENLWRSQFGGRASILGTSVNLDGKDASIIGIMPASFHFPRPETALWTNLALPPPSRRGPFFYRGLGRLKPSATLTQAQAELKALARQIGQEDTTWGRDLSFPAVPLREAMVGDVRPALVILFGAVCLVLLIAAANVANLLLARATVREREMALRLALGAGPSRLLRQLLTESAVLSLLGGGAGLAIAAWAIGLLRHWNAGNLPRVGEVHLDASALLFAVLVAGLTGLLFGLAPALQSSRAPFASALNEAMRSSAGGRRQRTRALLVVAEISLSLILLAGGALLLRSFARLHEVRIGDAPPDQVLTLQLAASGAKYADDRALIAFYRGLVDRVSQLPGVLSAAVSDSLPPDREGDADTYVIAHHPLRPGEINPITSAPRVGTDYFKTLGIPLLAGRTFDLHDTLTSPPVAVISEAMARRDFPGENPVGQRLKRSGIEDDSPYMEIVGVVANTHYLGLAQPFDAAYYEPESQGSNRRQYLAVRTRTEAVRMAPLVRGALRVLDPDLVITGVGTLQQDVAESVARPRFQTAILAGFALVAMLLAAIGVYGVIAYTVALRTQEIGLRLALGAGRADVLGLVVAQGARLALTGIGLGLLGALALTRLLAGLLFGVGTTDPLTLCGATLALGLVTLIACLLPACRATRIAPQSALRNQ